jgi:threonyl-tRNA synthetase
MNDIIVTLPDGSQKPFAHGLSYAAIAEAIAPRLAKASLAVKVDGQLVDIGQPCTQACSLHFVTSDSPEGLEIIRHSTAHVLAMAVKKLWPAAKVAIGPVIKDGFFYDIEFPAEVKIGENDFAVIEGEMKNIISSRPAVIREVLSRDTALANFTREGEAYKGIIISEIPAEQNISTYKIGTWTDLCRGPHVPDLRFLGIFKLTSVAGAYWRGDSKNTMLTRIYGTAWAHKQDLAAYLARIEEAKRRDHRVLGKQLDLFSFHPEATAHPFFHPKGAFIFQQLIEYMRRSNETYGFQEVNTPLMMSVDLWHKSGHYEHYRENMYFSQIDDNLAAIKPMNCPGHCLVYKVKSKSYRELPLKISEFGKVHRHEKSGVVSGLFRVRSFVQDDAHIFCQGEELLPMIQMILQQIEEVYRGLGFETYHMELSTRPEKYIGSDEVWEKAENALKTALEQSNRTYKLNPGDGAFYGPKIDFHLVDAIGRTWQCGTVQIDFSMPERFDLSYVSKDNDQQRPVMIHRAVLGSVERFMGIFLEHYAGHLPLWIAPTQVQIITIGQAHEAYAKEVAAELATAGIRSSLDLRNEKLGYKIREAQLNKYPYMLVLGDQEMNSKTLSPRLSNGTQLEAMNMPQLQAHLQAEIKKGK